MLEPLKNFLSFSEKAIDENYNIVYKFTNQEIEILPEGCYLKVCNHVDLEDYQFLAEFEKLDSVDSKPIYRKIKYFRINTTSPSEILDWVKIVIPKSDAIKFDKNKINRVFLIDYGKCHSFMKDKFIEWLKDSSIKSFYGYGTLLRSIPKSVVKSIFDEKTKTTDYYSIDETVEVYNITDFSGVQCWHPIYKQWDVQIPVNSKMKFDNNDS